MGSSILGYTVCPTFAGRLEASRVGRASALEQRTLPDYDCCCSISWGNRRERPLLVAVAVGRALCQSPGLKTVLWTLSLGFMGTVCLLNASRYGRTHCYFPGIWYWAPAVWAVRVEMDW